MKSKLDFYSEVHYHLIGLTCRTKEGARLVIREMGTGKFVQFVGSETECLLLDVPTEPLTELEFYRAVRFFKRFGVKENQEEAVKYREGIPAGRPFSFNMPFLILNEAAQAAVAFFREVYLLDGITDARFEKK
jgi:hypothetical protein